MTSSLICEETRQMTLYVSRSTVQNDRPDIPERRSYVRGRASFLVRIVDAVERGAVYIINPSLGAKCRVNLRRTQTVQYT